MQFSHTQTKQQLRAPIKTPIHKQQCKPRRNNPLIFSVKTLLGILARRPCTKAELRALTGLANTTISYWVNELAAKPSNIIYISAWRRRADRGQWSAVYSLGPMMDDEPKPERMSDTQYYLRYKAKREAREEKSNLSLKGKDR